MSNTLNKNIYHYEIPTDQKELHITYIHSDDQIIVRELPAVFTGQINKLPKIFEAYDFEQWVRDNGLLQQSLLQFSPEQDTWVDGEWTIPFTSWLIDSEKNTHSAILEFLEENGFEY
jgi:hypothetical protein